MEEEEPRAAGLLEEPPHSTEGRDEAEPGPVMENRVLYPQQEASVSVGMAGRLTVNRPFFSGVEGCSLRSSV